MNGHATGSTSGERSHAKSVRQTSALQWFADRTGIDRSFLASLNLDDRSDCIAFTFKPLNACKVRRATDDKQKRVWWEDHGVPPPFWPMPAGSLPRTIVLTEGESDCCTFLFCRYDALAFTLGAHKVPEHAALVELAERGVDRLVIAGDIDEVGTTWALRTARAAHAAGMTAAVIDLSLLASPLGSDFKDANDLFRSCETIDGFRDKVEMATVEVDAPADETVTLDAFLEVGEREIPWLIEDLLAAGEIALVAAPQKTYKTWLTVVLVRALATAGEFLQPGWRARRTHRILLVEEEGSDVKFAQRFRTANFRGDVAIRFRKGSDLTSPEFVDAVIAQIRDGEFEVLVLDPLQRMAPGVNENDAGEMGRLWDNVHRIARECPSLAIIVVHHFNKNAQLGWQGVRGSSRTGGEVDVAFFLERTDSGIKLAIDGRDIPQYLNASEALDVSVEIDGPNRILKMEVQGTVKIKVRATSQIRAAIEEFLQKEGEAHRTTDEILGAVAGSTGMTPSSEGVRKHLRALENEGLVAGQVVGTQGAKGWTWVKS
jgi:hypothetical protein